MTELFRSLALFLLKFLILSVLIFIACSDNGVKPDPDKNSTEPKTVFSEPVPSGGGIVTVQGSNTVLDGMEITIPASAASAAQDLKVSIFPADSADTSKGFKPVSPVISISGPSRVDSSIYTISIPCKADTGQFVMAFQCDNQGHILEAVPLLDRTDSSIVIATASFAKASGLSRSRAGAINTSFEFIVRSISNQMLASSPVISSGFKPGTDDWEFVNYGSYIAPSGHCAGQSISAMWYYYEKKLKGGRSLYHAFDSINISADKIWQDNPQGFRTASMVQRDIPFEGIMFNFLNNATKTKKYDQLTFQAFAAAMLATGEPQLVGIRSNHGGHAIVAYKVSQQDKKIYVADPNFPGQERIISMAGDTFMPYSSKQNANQIDASSYTKFAYFAKSALIDWTQIGTRMKEMENGIAGNGVFPAYTLQVAEGSGYPLTDGFSTDKDTLVFEAISTACQASYGGTGRQHLEVFDYTGNLMAESGKVNAGAQKGQVFIVLKPGKNHFGVAVWGWHKADSTASADYIDFKWLNVTYNSLTMEPEQVSGKLDSLYRFIVKPTGTAPSSREYEWDFGDGSSKQTIRDSVVTHTFIKTGTLTLTVSLKDRTTGKTVAQGKATALISGGTPSIDSIVPAKAHALDTIVIYGHNFGMADKSSFVDFSMYDTADTYVVWNDSTIAAIVPNNAQTGWLNVRTAGASSSSVMFTRLLDRPVITAVSPAQIFAGDTVTIKGKYFRQKNNGNERFCQVMFPVGTASQISGTQWGDSLFVWTDTLVKVRAPAPVMSGGLLYTADKDTSAPYTIKVGYRIGRILIGNCDARVNAKLTYYDSILDVQNMDFTVSPQKPQTQSASATSINLVYDTLYESGSTLVTRVHKRYEITLSVDFDKAMLTSMNGEALDEYTNVQSGNSTTTKTTLKGGPLPLSLVNNGSRTIDSLTSLTFKISGDTACTKITQITYDNTSSNQFLKSFTCSPSSVLSAYITYVRGKP
jgi:hypothetical protein